MVFHVLNRGNARNTVFHRPEEYRHFIARLDEAKSRFPVELYAFCVMPNHFHAVLKPRTEGALSAFMQWWMTAHVRWQHSRSGGSGHLWQGRFKSFPIEDDEHLLTVLRYTLLNPVRAGLARQADGWDWSSVRFAQMTDPWPVTKPASLTDWLRVPLEAEKLAEVRRCVTRRAPFGSAQWRVQVAHSCGLEPTLRPRGRPSLRCGATGGRRLPADDSPEDEGLRNTSLSPHSEWDAP